MGLIHGWGSTGGIKMSALLEQFTKIGQGADTGTLGKIGGLFGTLEKAGGEIYGGISAGQQGRAVARAYLKRAAYEADLRRREGKRLLGTQAAGYAASGVEPQGSPLLVMDETIRNAEADAQMIEKEGKAKSDWYKSAASGQLTAGLMEGGTTLLTRAGGLLKNVGRRKIPSSSGSDFLGLNWYTD